METFPGIGLVSYSYCKVNSIQSSVSFVFIAIIFGGTKKSRDRKKTFCIYSFVFRRAHGCISEWRPVILVECLS
jgi:hypothetical protein